MANGAIERYLLEFNDALVAGAERRERILAEVEDHLRDAARSLQAAGMPPPEAEVEAVARFGEPAAAAERFGPDPLGRAQQVGRWYEARRIAHPILVPIVAVSPWVALITWTSGAPWLALIVALPMVWAQISTNLRARGAAFAVDSPTIARLRDLPRLGTIVSCAAVIAVAVVIVDTTTGWFQAMIGYYAVCAVAIFSARPSRCVDPTCERCSRRWSARHPSAAAGVAYATWVLALAGPVLAEIVPLTARHFGPPLFFLMVFSAIAPLPTRRSEAWLCRHRPASQVALRLMLPLALLVLQAVREPSYWVLAVVGAALMAYMAATLEVRRSRFRSDATRRRLLERVRGVAGDGATR